MTTDRASGIGKSQMSRHERASDRRPIQDSQRLVSAGLRNSPAGLAAAGVMNSQNLKPRMQLFCVPPLTFVNALVRLAGNVVNGSGLGGFVEEGASK